ncbi:hypothetical protein WR25_15045 [Diploscapter pachys]|uniref:Fatty acid desaturase domain-containing protein n=1 Tax=Diploscapter pachys TaxID=2018661 RepID=A0A2A2LEJ3_9BILA|nr:hypothetical protein WR25_15045 [Diploscapter pachys]
MSIKKIDGDQFLALEEDEVAKLDEEAKQIPFKTVIVWKNVLMFIGWHIGDTNADPHSTKRGFFFAHMGWLLVKKHPQIKTQGAKLDLSDLYEDPVCVWQRQFGYKPYDSTVSAVQTDIFNIIAQGEGHHNYHHVFPQDYRASESPWTSNLTRGLIDLFAKMGLVYDRKIVSDDVIRKQATGHGDGKYESKDAMPKWQYIFTLFLSFVIFMGGVPLFL